MNVIPTTTSPSSPTGRVRRGAARLDEVGPPNWRELVDARRLRTSSTRDCVLGQVYDSYEVGVELLGGPPVYWSSKYDRERWTVDHGFEAPYHQLTLHRDYHTLDATWREYLAGDLGGTKGD